MMLSNWGWKQPTSQWKRHQRQCLLGIPFMLIYLQLLPCSVLAIKTTFKWLWTRSLSNTALKQSRPITSFWRIKLRTQTMTNNKKIHVPIERMKPFLLSVLARLHLLGTQAKGQLGSRNEQARQQAWQEHQQKLEQQHPMAVRSFWKQLWATYRPNCRSWKPMPRKKKQQELSSIGGSDLVAKQASAPFMWMAGNEYRPYCVQPGDKRPPDLTSQRDSYNKTHGKKRYEPATVDPEVKRINEADWRNRRITKPDTI